MVRDSLVDQFMLSTHLYLMLGKKIEAWFLSPASREYFGVKSTAYLSASKFSQKIYPLLRWTAKYVYFISKAMKVAVSLSKFKCLYAMLLLWGNSKHGLSVA